MADQPAAGQGTQLNDRTYQEVEYLKKNLGPILVAALAEICIRRPADPIEYLGHWLLRWRYNEELKRRDVQNALEVVRRKTWTKEEEAKRASGATQDQPADVAPTEEPAPAAEGFIPSHPYGPPGYGGQGAPTSTENAVPTEGGSAEETTAAEAVTAEVVEGAEGAAAPETEGEAEETAPTVAPPRLSGPKETRVSVPAEEPAAPVESVAPEMNAEPTEEVVPEPSEIEAQPAESAVEQEE